MFSKISEDGIWARRYCPEFLLDVLLVSVPYPRATPDEVESGICQKTEESIQSPTRVFAAIGPTARLCAVRPWLGSQSGS